jgi:hypothetical protein
MPAVNDVGEPCAGEPHARFDGRELETEQQATVTGTGQPRGKPQEQRLRDLPPQTATAPAPDPTQMLATRRCPTMARVITRTPDKQGDH